MEKKPEIMGKASRWFVGIIFLVYPVLVPLLVCNLYHQSSKDQAAGSVPSVPSSFLPTHRKFYSSFDSSGANSYFSAIKPTFHQVTPYVSSPIHVPVVQLISVPPLAYPNLIRTLPPVAQPELLPPPRPHYSFAYDFANSDFHLALLSQMPPLFKLFDFYLISAWDPDLDIRTTNEAEARLLRTLDKSCQGFWIQVKNTFLRGIISLRLNIPSLQIQYVNEDYNFRFSINSRAPGARTRRVYSNSGGIKSR